MIDKMQIFIRHHHLIQRGSFYFVWVLIAVFVVMPNCLPASSFILNPSGPHYLRGKVYHHLTGRVLAGVNMKISNGHSTTSDSQGYFALNLDIGEKYQPGTNLTIYLMDDRLGNDVVELTLPQNLDRDVRIVFKNDRYFVLSGTVIDKESNNLLQGVTLQASPEIQGLHVKPPPPVISDKMGNFWITFDREIYGEFNYVKLTARYPDEGIYEDYIQLERVMNGLSIQLEAIENVDPSQNESAARDVSEAENGTICITNTTNSLIRISVHKRYPTKQIIFEGGAEIITKIGPGESPSFNNMTPGPYIIKQLEQTTDVRRAIETFTTVVSAGKTAEVIIR